MSGSQEFDWQRLLPVIVKDVSYRNSINYRVFVLSLNRVVTRHILPRIYNYGLHLERRYSSLLFVLSSVTLLYLVRYTTVKMQSVAIFLLIAFFSSHWYTNLIFIHLLGWVTISQINRLGLRYFC